MNIIKRLIGCINKPNKENEKHVLACNNSDNRKLNPDKRIDGHEKQKQFKINHAKKYPLSKDKIIFHGCCHSCMRPEVKGIGDCLDCRYCQRYATN